MIIKKVVTHSAIIGVGFLGGFISENQLDQQRFPIHIEYSIIEQCAKGHGKGVTDIQQAKILSKCICALEKSQTKYAEGERIQSPHQFKIDFLKYKNSCSVKK